MGAMGAIVGITGGATASIKIQRHSNPTSHENLIKNEVRRKYSNTSNEVSSMWNTRVLLKSFYVWEFYTLASIVLFQVSIPRKRYVFLRLWNRVMATEVFINSKKRKKTSLARHYWMSTVSQGDLSTGQETLRHIFRPMFPLLCLSGTQTAGVDTRVVLECLFWF